MAASAAKALPVILNVDDNERTRNAKTHTLKLAGFDVLEAATGLDALDIAQKNLPDLVLLDVKLPDISGLEVCRRIKRDPVMSSVLVLQTAASLTDGGVLLRALEEGADNYLVGPVEPLELIANVKALLRLGETQRALQENEERFRQMAENIDDVFWIFDPKQQQIFYVSPAYEKLWGLKSSDLYKNFHAWEEIIHPDDRERTIAAFEDLLRYRDYDQEFRLLMKDGSERWVRDRGFPVRDGGGVNYRITRVSQDISAPKAAAIALREAAIRKDEFLATLAHELRNPLAPMRTAIELMRLPDAQKTNAGDVAADAREMISRQIDHLVRLVDDLLDVSRITQGKLSLKKRLIEVHPIIGAAVETNESFIRERQHTLRVTVPSEKLWINGDSVRLVQVVNNLLHNAARYTPSGGEIELNVKAFDDRLRIIVSDNGIGISRENIDQIFDLFTQAERLDSKAPEGLGVGLSLVRRLVELHGGNVDVQSPGIGGGSVFTIDLPLDHKLKSAKKEVPKHLNTTAENPLRILLVDDSVDAVNMMCLLLQSMGHDVAVANDARTALALAPKLIPHVVLLDIGLPGADGYEVARELVKMPELQKTKLVALTGYGQDKDRELAFASGFSHHFIKPVEIADLNNLLRTIEPF